MIAPRSIGNSTWCAGALSVVALAALGAVLCLGSPEPAEARNGQKGLAQTPAQSCGPLALAKALYLLGHSVDASRCAERVRTAADGSTTMAGLVSAARSLGETAIGMRLSPAELALVNRPAILHVRLPHASEHSSSLLRVRALSST